MADWNLPVNTTAYTNVLQNLKDRDVDCATMDFSTATNIPDGTIRWNAANSRFEKWNATASAWEPLATLYNINVNQLDGYDAGNASGNIPVSNGTLNTNLNADMVDGRHAGNANGDIPINNSVLNTNLNADLLDGYHAGNASGNVPVSNGTLNTNLNADMVDGKHATSFVHDPVGSGLMAGDEIFEVSWNMPFNLKTTTGVSVYMTVPTTQTIGVGSFRVSVPAGKVLRLRRIRYYLGAGLGIGYLRVRINGTTVTSGYNGDETPNTVIYDNSTGASAVEVTVNAGIYNGYSSDVDVTSFTIWAQFTIT